MFEWPLIVGRGLRPSPPGEISTLTMLLFIVMVTIVVYAVDTGAFAARLAGDVSNAIVWQIIGGTVEGALIPPWGATRCTIAAAGSS